MRASDNTEAACFDPEYSVLALARRGGCDGARFVDAATGWLARDRGPQCRAVRSGDERPPRWTAAPGRSVCRNAPFDESVRRFSADQ